MTRQWDAGGAGTSDREARIGKLRAELAELRRRAAQVEAELARLDPRDQTLPLEELNASNDE